MKRRAKGTPRLTNEELQSLQPHDLMEIHSEIPEMGTVTIRTNRTDLNCMQVYRVYKQRQAIEQFSGLTGQVWTLKLPICALRQHRKHGFFSIISRP